AGDPHPGRSGPAVRRHPRRHHLYGRARSVLGHQSPVLVLLDRPPAHRGGDVPAQRDSRRPGPARLGLASHGAGPTPAAPVRPILSTRGLAKSFGSLVVAQDIDFVLPRGVRYALIGPNGAGKTTLINMMTGMLRPDAGRIFLGEDDITSLTAAERVKRGLVRTFQITTLFPHLTALE